MQSPLRIPSLSLSEPLLGASLIVNGFVLVFKLFYWHMVIIGKVHRS